MGVDVGAERKGFDVAVIDDGELLPPQGRLTCRDVVDIVREVKPAVVAIDSPRSCAPTGERTRACERLLARRICGIRWTPDAASVRAGEYYAWVVEGLKLYEALEPFPLDVIEVFPTASWTRWLGPRGSQRRSRWTQRGLTTLDLGGIPKRTNQDTRDAIAAAVTARQHTGGMTETIGEIVVPRGSADRR